MYRSAVAAIVGGTVVCDGWGNRHLRLQPDCDAARLLSLNAAATPPPTTVAPATAAPTASPTAGCCDVVSVSGHTNPAWNGRYTMCVLSVTPIPATRHPRAVDPMLPFVNFTGGS